MWKQLVAMTVVGAVLVFTGWATRLDSVVEAQNPPARGSASQGQQGPNMQDMMKMHEQMMADMKAADAKLDALVKDMNAATGNAKVTAIAVVVTELVRQNRSMHEHMGQMHQQMMGRGMMMNR
jgi:hypothetical protein